jgi:hypothetical protein
LVKSLAQSLAEISGNVMRPSVMDVMNALGMVVVGNLKAVTPVGARGALRNRTTYRIVERSYEWGDVVEMQIIQPARRRGGAGRYYRPHVTMGTRPHRPPSRFLIPWVRKVFGYSGRQAVWAAWLVASAIAKHGTKPNNYTEVALRNSQPDIEDAAELIGDFIVARLADDYRRRARA